jgi:hypothetical protein
MVISAGWRPNFNTRPEGAMRPGSAWPAASAADASAKDNNNPPKCPDEIETRLL